MENKLEQWKKDNGVSWKFIASKIGIEVCALKQIRLKRSTNVKASTVSAIFLLTGLSPLDYLDFTDEEKEKVMQKAKSIWDYKLKD